MDDHPLRVYSRQLFTDIFKDEARGHNAELGVKNWAVEMFSSNACFANDRFKTQYKHKVLGLKFNLLNPENPKLLQRVLDREIATKDLAKMAPDELWPENWEAIKAKQQAREEKRDVPDGLIQCGRCKKHKTTYYSVQTRSADEPMTVFVTCIPCNRRWKM